MISRDCDLPYSMESARLQFFYRVQLELPVSFAAEGRWAPRWLTEKYSGWARG
jgi:hypothetical protein